MLPLQLVIASRLRVSLNISENGKLKVHTTRPNVSSLVKVSAEYCTHIYRASGGIVLVQSQLLTVDNIITLNYSQHRDFLNVERRA